MRYGYFRIYILLRREGWGLNHKRVHRLYREEGLSLRLKRPRGHVSAVHWEHRPPAAAPNELWSIDFVSDALFNSRRFRALTVVDTFTREALAIEVDQGISGAQVVAVAGLWLLGSSGYSALLAAHLGLSFAFAAHHADEIVEPALALYRQKFGPSAVLDRPDAMPSFGVLAADEEREVRRQAWAVRRQMI